VNKFAAAVFCNSGSLQNESDFNRRDRKDSQTWRRKQTPPTNASANDRHSTTGFGQRPTTNDGFLFVNQVPLVKLLEFEEVVLPVERDAMGIFGLGKRVIHGLVRKNLNHLFHVVLLWV